MKYPLFVATLLGLAVASGAAAPQNIALSRPWTATPSMGKHPDTHNEQEYRKLTDGKRATGPLWESREATVGWGASRTPVKVTIDLGKRQPISGLAVGSGAGVALDSKRIYYWPGLIDIFVSDNKKEWHHVGELTSLSDSENAPLPAFSGEYAYRNISTTRLRTAGRYVQLVFSARAEVFLDEVEVYAGDESLLAEKPQGKALTSDKIDDFINRPDATLFVTQRRYRQDIDAIERQLINLSEKEAEPIRASLRDLKAEVDGLKDQPKDKRAAIPVGDLGRRILQQQATVWRAQGAAPVTLWQQDLWAPLYWMTPPPAKADVKLAVSQIRGEHRSTSFNLTNASAEEQTLLISLSDLPGGKHPENLEVRATEWNEQVDRTTTAYALIPAKKVDGGYEITIPSGVTRQVWLTFLGSGEAGTVNAKVNVAAQGNEAGRFEIPLTVQLFPYTFPEKQALHFSGWDYITSYEVGRYGLGPWNMESAHALLQKYRMDVNWSPVTSLDRGKFNEAGEYARAEDEPDVSKFKEWVSLWPNAHRYYVNIAAFNKMGDARIMGHRHEDDPEGFFKRVTNWLQFWEKQVKSMGIDPRRVALLIIDEPGLHGATPYAYDDVIATWVEAIRRSGTSFTQWMDPVYEEPWKANQANMDAMDEICVKYAHLIIRGEEYVNYYKKRAEKQQLSLYECYPIVGGFDPYSYYRLQAWMSWSMNGNAVGIWAVGDAGRAASFGSWNNGLNPLHYSPLFIDRHSPEVYAGKGIEAIREGIYDYQYLVMLRDAIAEAKEQKRNPEAIAAAEQLLEAAPRRVLWENKALAEPKWLPSTKINRTVADTVRLEILQAMNRLSQ